MYEKVESLKMAELKQEGVLVWIEKMVLGTPGKVK